MCCYVLTVNDQYDELIKNFLLLVKQELTVHDPQPIDSIEDQHIQADNIDLFLSQTDTQVSKFSENILAHGGCAIVPYDVQTRIVMTIPETIVSGKYSIRGSALGRKVTGSGDMTITIDNLNVIANGSFVQPDSSLQLDSLILGWDANDLKVHFTGLSVEGIAPDQLDEFARSIMVTAIGGKKDKIVALASVYIQSTINEEIAGKPLTEVIAWIKSLIH
ncbi:Hypothetical protein NTJ_03125 [Nesidiocoris tenuis]|uniref:Lipid-binding serum glycoprotein N-terminal domain-containing protein n=1 Tax=Nesidiocoris tenuis TaxID=355587 RepID=A0ABN7AGC6_9HEMI|nr:Hypothetical protein NTJ_03125 [Nesidiocoris tenuis]